MDKWARLQTASHDKDERLKSNRKHWKTFQRQLEDLEQASEQLTNKENLSKRATLSAAVIGCPSV